MRAVILCLFLALATSISSFAVRQVDIANTGGTLTGSSAGLAVTNSTLTLVNNLYGGMITGNLGTVAFQTGALTSGDLQNGATFASGGSFTVTGNGTNGVPNGSIFVGSFSQTVTWQLITLSNGTHNYNMTGTVYGTVYTDYKTYEANGVTFQLTVNTGTGYFNQAVSLSSGNLNILCKPGY
jgi:hypothetical protein